MPENTDRIKNVLDAIDLVNKKDQRKEIIGETSWPKEYLYAIRSSEILLKHWPNANELLQIATRGHHIERWAIPRSDYPMDRNGYLKWRTQLKVHHGKVLANIMNKYGYNDSEIKTVQQMVMKTKLKSDIDTQTLEDVICLVFLTYYLDDFATKHDRNKIVSIIQKTWGKMSTAGHQHALNIQFSDLTGDIVKEAI